MPYNSTVTLTPLDESNTGEVCELKYTVEQRQFTNSPLWALLQTGFGYHKDKRTTYAVILDNQVIRMLTVEKHDIN
jgi:hypothetical protein